MLKYAIWAEKDGFKCAEDQKYFAQCDKDNDKDKDNDNDKDKDSDNDKDKDKWYCDQSVPRAPPGTTTSAALTTKKCIFSGTTVTIISDHIASEYTCELLILKLLDKTQPILCMWCSSVLMTFFLFLLPLAPSDRASLVRFKSSERSPPWWK